MSASVQALAEVHFQDGYPTRWPADPGAWLSPPDLLGAWVAVDDGEINGHVVLAGGVDNAQLIEAAGRPATELAMVSRLFVRPAIRGRRVGQQLLATVTAFAEEHETGLVLDVVDERRSAAIALYEQLGWRLVGHEPAGWVTAAGVRPQLRLYVLSAHASRA